MIKALMLVISVMGCVTQMGVAMLHHGWPPGVALLVLGGFPMVTLLVIRRSLRAALTDMVAGMADVSLVLAPALLGATAFGVAGAVAGAVAGHVVVDGLGGRFAQGIGTALRCRDIQVLRESAASALGKMAGALLAGGVILSVLLLAGFHLRAY